MSEPSHTDNPPVVDQPPFIDGNFDSSGPDIATAVLAAADQPVLSKRASNVLKLYEENDKLRMELKALSDRLEAAEKKRVELAKREEQQQQHQHQQYQQYQQQERQHDQRN